MPLLQLITGTVTSIAIIDFPIASITSSASKQHWCANAIVVSDYYNNRVVKNNSFPFAKFRQK